MRHTWMTDMRHYLDERGDLAPKPGPAMNLALFMGSIVAWATSHAEPRVRTNVACRRSPGRVRCRGEILAAPGDEPGRIVWECPECGDNGITYGWEGTRWDRCAG
jgi:hypothetical protein